MVFADVGDNVLGLCFSRVFSMGRGRNTPSPTEKNIGTFEMKIQNYYSADDRPDGRLRPLAGLAASFLLLESPVRAMQ